MPESREAKRNSLVGAGPRAADPSASANELWGPRSIPRPEMLPPFLLSRKLATRKPAVRGWCCVGFFFFCSAIALITHNDLGSLINPG